VNFAVKLRVLKKFASKLIQKRRSVSLSTVGA
jgi:hypothetical protein